MFYLSSKASRIRQKEAQDARNNRAEIVKALSIGQITKRDLYKWGLLVAGTGLAMKNGLSPFARSAFASVPTGTPLSPLYNAAKYSQPLPRLALQQPMPLYKVKSSDPSSSGDAAWPSNSGERPSRRLSYHTDFTANPSDPQFRNPLTNRGPIEGRPPGEIFAHQRWDEFFPKVGYVSSWGQVATGSCFHPSMAPQNANSLWTYGTGRFSRGTLPPPLFKLRYGEPVMHRVYNNTPIFRGDNGGFGRNESQLHFHNAHNGAESDGAANVHHFPGTFYDYRWSTTLARRDKINTQATDKRASGPDGKGGLVNVAGDWRELQGTLWAHDHRFFFTAENVYKGNLMMVNMYSGRDRGNEKLDDGVNLRLPSGSLLDYGNCDFDVNLIISDHACDQNGQMFFDIFDTQGFLGDMPLVNMSYCPVLDVLPRKYRFRILSAGMSRFIQLMIADPNGNAVQFLQIANDGNLFVNPIPLTSLDQQGTAERYDIIVDFSKFRIGDRLTLVNTLQQTDGRMPDKQMSLQQALSGNKNDPCSGGIMQFRVASSVQSVDVPGYTYYANARDESLVPAVLTEQIPIVAPVRERVVEWGRAGTGDSRQANGQCIPDCSETGQFPWTIKVNGQSAHSMNANRVSLLYPKPGEVEHWTYINGGGGWDHPIHLHFEEGITMNRGNQSLPATENLVRKDVWRLRPAGRVQFQIQFGEYGGSYVNHCHNTVHEDFALLMRIQLLNGVAGTPQAAVTATPNPTADGVFFTTPEVLPEADPSHSVGVAPGTQTGQNGGGSGSSGGGGSSGGSGKT
jgi:FtsP/CotA-like multicopper oxidase with cupredoxin domain